MLDQSPIFAGNGIAHRVGDVDGRGTRLKDGVEHLHQVVDVAPGGVFGGELNVLTKVPGDPDGLYGGLQHFGPGSSELVFQVDVRSGDEGVNPGLVRSLQGLPGPLDIHSIGPAQTGDGGLPHLAGNGLHGLEVSLGSDGEPGLDDVHVQPLQLTSHLQFFLKVHGASGRLLAVTQCGVEYVDFFRHGHLPRVGLNRKIAPNSSRNGPSRSILEPSRGSAVRSPAARTRTLPDPASGQMPD